jgi:lactoylglutathione lyase
MPHFIRLTPNLLVASIDRSLAFYADLLGFDRGVTVPDHSPFVFASVTSGSVEIFFNDAAAAVKEYPQFAGRTIGATGTMYIEVDAVDALHHRIKDRVNVMMPLVTQFYGAREFAIEDPDGYLITFAQRIQQ